MILSLLLNKLQEFLIFTSSSKSIIYKLLYIVVTIVEWNIIERFNNILVGNVRFYYLGNSSSYQYLVPSFTKHRTTILLEISTEITTHFGKGVTGVGASNNYP